MIKRIISACDDVEFEEGLFTTIGGLISLGEGRSYLRRRGR
jgi:hypothetical protein